MIDETIPQTLDAIFSEFIMADESSTEEFVRIIAAYDLIDSAIHENFKEIEVHHVCRETKVLLELIAAGECRTPKKSFEVVGEAMAVMQLLLQENASPGDVHMPVFDQTNSENGEASPQDPALSEAEAKVDEEELNLDEPYELAAFLADSEMAMDFLSESVEHIEQVDVHLLTLEHSADDSETLNAVFRAFHTIKGLSGFFGLTYIQDFAHVAETLLDNARNEIIVLEGLYLDLTFDANECLKKAIAELQSAIEGGQSIYPNAEMLGVQKNLHLAVDAIANNESAPTQEPVAPVVQVEDPPSVEDESPSAPEEPTKPEQEVPITTSPEVASADVKPAAPKEKSKSPKAAKKPTEPENSKAKVVVRETIRVDAMRLDVLMESVGELVIAEAILTESDEMKSIQSTKIESLLGHMEKITRELQSMAMSLRMTPIRPTFQKMARLARDVAKKLDRKVDFVTAGDDTELDKSVVDALGDPLIHMVRNAIDHGLEKTVEDRIAAGKPEAGQVELRAFHQGGNIVIEIEDDGRGMNRDVILKKAIENGVVTDGDGLSDPDVFGLIFAPGFSTAETITDVSGRGVGLDVVKRGIEALRGTVEVDSVRGKGTVFTMRLPLTLAIIEGMVVRVGDQKYIVPTLSIVRMQKFDPDEISTVLETGRLLSVGNELVPVYRLSHVFGMSAGKQSESMESVIIVEGNRRRYAFVVDELIGQRQIVIKGLGHVMGSTEGLSGGAIMPDGRVGLIVDITSLVKLAESSAATPVL